MEVYANPANDPAKLARSPLDKVIEAIAILAVVANLVLIATEWPNLPQRIPHHFDFAGNPDAWGPKGLLFLLPALSMAIYIMLTVIARVPHRLNVPWEITEANAEQTYRIALSLIRMLKAEVAIVFAYITWQTIRAARQQTFGLGKFFLLVVIATLAITIITHVLAAYRVR